MLVAVVVVVVLGFHCVHILMLNCGTPSVPNYKSFQES